MSPVPSHWPEALARSLAWAVHTSGWLVLGAAGAQQLPLWFGGLLPTALWLGLVALLMQAQAGCWLPASRVQAGWCLAVLMLALAMATALPLLLAVAWAVGSAAASWTVRLSRGPQRAPWSQALWPALAGLAAGGASAMPVLLGAPQAAGLPAVAGGGLVLGGVCAVLLLRRAPARPACQWDAPGGWRAALGLHGPAGHAAGAPATLPQRLALASMLPMMAGLPTLLGLCTGGVSPAAMLLLHLGAMLLPAAGLWAWRTAMAPDPAWACAALLIGGALALPALPLFQGLMLASLMHTMAWSLAWAAGQSARARRAAWAAGGAPGGLPEAAGRSAATAPLQAAGAAAAPLQAAGAAARPLQAAGAAGGGVLLLGLALQAMGPWALCLAHAALGLLALLWALGRLRSWPGLVVRH